MGELLAAGTRLLRTSGDTRRGAGHFGLPAPARAARGPKAGPPARRAAARGLRAPQFHTPGCIIVPCWSALRPPAVGFSAAPVTPPRPCCAAWRCSAAMAAASRRFSLSVSDRFLSFTGPLDGSAAEDEEQHPIAAGR